MADLVLYDHFLSKEVLDLVCEGTRLLHAGKTVGHHSHTQVSENDRLFHVRIKIHVLWGFCQCCLQFVSLWLVDVMQEEMHEMIFNFAEVGHNVVRLKGGDPW
jgi:siroheme synthase